MIRPWAYLVLICIGGGLYATELDLPASARLTADITTPLDSVQIPVDVFRDGDLPTQRIEGAVSRSAWRLDNSDLTPLQVTQPLRRQLEDAGFDIVLDCLDVDCGGFDFRFATDVLPGPNMYVNLRSFHHLTAIKGDRASPEAAITVLVSNASVSVYVQVIRVTPQAPTANPVVMTSRASDSVPVGDLLAQGHVVLEDLSFTFGSADLGPGPFPSLQALADFLDQNADARLALVGHTDTVGGLEPNILLSRQRAQSVVRRLVDAYGVSPARLDAEGMGYLAPIASNRTEAGREINRRVEAVLLN